MATWKSPMNQNLAPSQIDWVLTSNASSVEGMRIRWEYNIEMRAAGKNDHGCIEFRLRLRRTAKRRTPPQKDIA